MHPTILVVEPHAGTRELLELHLSRNGYRVLAAKDALAAMSLVLDESPDLIVADVDAKYLDGLRFLAAVREDGSTRRLPLLLLTASDERAERALVRVARGVPKRPLVAGRLLAAVAEQLGG